MYIYKCIFQCKWFKCIHTVDICTVWNKILMGKILRK